MRLEGKSAHPWPTPSCGGHPLADAQATSPPIPLCLPFLTGQLGCYADF